MGQQLVYGDGWEDLKDVFTLSNRGGRNGSCWRDCKGSSRLAMSILLLWVIILTIVCIVLSLNIEYSSNKELSSRLDSHVKKHENHVSTSHQTFQGLHRKDKSTFSALKDVSSGLNSLESDLDHLEGKMGRYISYRVAEIKDLLLSSLDATLKSIQEVREQVRENIRGSSSSY